jgi:tetratricopeptide (TPR) repeat protein
LKATEVVWRIRRATLIGTLALGVCVPGLTQDFSNPSSITDYDPREVALLPHYCIYTQLFREHVPGGSDITQIQAWRSFMGPEFEAMHHYCFGLMKTNRATLHAQNKDQRLFYLTDAVTEYDFVLQRVPNDFIVLPEILTKKGENLVRMGREPLALIQFNRAIEVKPDYWTAYGDLSDLYKQQGNLTEARKVLEKGLSFSPNAPGLKRRMAELATSADDKKASRRSSPSASASAQP